MKDSSMLFVCAAGNDNTDTEQKPAYPANYDLTNVISAAASDFKDQLSDFSNYGGNIDVAAPGENILQTSGIWLSEKEIISPQNFDVLERSGNLSWSISDQEIKINGSGGAIIYETNPTILNGRDVLLVIDDTSAYLPFWYDYMYLAISPVPFSSYATADEAAETDGIEIYKWFGNSGLMNEYVRSPVILINADAIKNNWNVDQVYIGYDYRATSSSKVTIRGISKYKMSLGWEVKKGTSMAVPHVSSTAALMLSVNPDLTPEEIAAIIRQTADRKESLYMKTSSGGRLNTTAAVKEALCFPVSIPDKENPSENIRLMIDQLAGRAQIENSYDLNRDGIIDGRDLILLQCHIKITTP